MSAPQVDIVIPLYNKERVIARTLNSVLAQTYDNWRLFVVDDGSTDRSVRIVSDYLGDRRITLVAQENAGPGPARNHGLSLSDARFVAFLDADDEWLPSFLAHTVPTLNRNEQCAAVSSSWYYGDPQRDMSGFHSERGVQNGPWRCPPVLEYKAIKDAVDFCASSAMVCRTKAIKQLGGFFARTHCTYGEDSFLWLKLISQYPVFRLLEPLVKLHTDASALSAGRQDAYPAPPVLTHSHEFLASVPDSHRPLLNGYLDWYRLRIAKRMLKQNSRNSAIRLLKGPRFLSSDKELKKQRRRLLWRAWLTPYRRLLGV